MTVVWARFGSGGFSNGTHCYYCGRSLPDVLEQGCGSEEFRTETQARRNALCGVYQEARRKG